MKSKLIVFTVFILFNLFSTKLFSQPLSGTYTIGGTSPDFATITDAVDIITAHGMSGAVIFDIRNGTYYENITIDSIPGNYLDPLTLQSETGDSSAVIIEDTGYSYDPIISLTEVKNINFKSLTLFSDSASTSECLSSDSSNFTVKHCLLQVSSGNSYGNLASLEYSMSGLFDSCSFIGPNVGISTYIGKNIIKNCFFNTPGGALGIDSGVIYFENNNLQPLGAVGYSSYPNADTIYFENNIVSQNLALGGNYIYLYRNSFLSTNFTGENNYSFNGDILYAEHNNFVGPCGLEGNDSAFISNNDFEDVGVLFPQLDGIGYGGYCKLDSNYGYGVEYYTGNVYADSNQFKSVLINYVDSPFFINNDNDSSINISYCYEGFISNSTISNATIAYTGLVDMDHNIVSSLSSTYDDYTILTRNKIQDLSVLYNFYETEAYNNEISSSLNFSYDSITKFYHNNVLEGIDGNYGFTFCDYVYLTNNNFNYPQPNFLSNIIADYNNYFPFVDAGELHSVSIDPQYTSATNLTTQNPLLIGKGEDLLPFVHIDIDSFPRHIHPTIGANELCFTGDGVDLRTVNIPCGDSVMLTQCNYNAGYTYSWEPATGLSNSSIYNPMLSATNSGTYICTIKSGNTLIERDTVTINVNPFKVTAYEDTSIQYCGYGLSLNATYNSSATYQWAPSTGLSDSNLQSPFANPSVTTTYTVTAIVPDCGTSTSSVVITVNPLPISYAYLYSQYHNFIEFLNASTCADNYLWEFCDGTTDTATNPIHIFTDTGYCLVTLIACNSYGCDTFSSYVYIDSIKVSGIANLLSNTNSLQIFPNPTNDILNISLNQNLNTNQVQIEIFDMLGQSHYVEDFSSYSGSFQQKIDLSNLAKGIYIVKVKSGEDNYYREVILQ